MADRFDAAGLPNAQPASWQVHGGPDARGAARFDFSTNSNACGPCPHTVAAVQQADATRYPDPAYTALRARLAAFHGVAPYRIVLAVSASEFIHRITALSAQRGVHAVALPEHSYGDYAQAAQARGLQRLRPADAGHASAGLQWACEPSSPLGDVDLSLAAWRAEAQSAGRPASGLWRIVDCAYAPLRLDVSPPGGAPLPATVWQLWTPNKALGLTGVRAAYAIAPQQVQQDDLAALHALSPSWPVGAHGVAMLTSWVQADTQRWLAGSLHTLRGWKAAQQALCTSLGWTVVPASLANYFVAHVPVPDLASALARLCCHGIQLRDGSSFGLPGHVRLGVLAPAAQQALQRAWED